MDPGSAEGCLGGRLLRNTCLSISQNFISGLNSLESHGVDPGFTGWGCFLRSQWRGRGISSGESKSNTNISTSVSGYHVADPQIGNFLQ